MKILKAKAHRKLLDEEEVMDVLGSFGLAYTKRQLRYILDKGELKYKVVQVNNLVKQIRVYEGSLYAYIVKKIPAMKEVLPVYYDYLEGKLEYTNKGKTHK